MSSAPLSPVKQAFLAVQAAQTRIAALEAERTAPIAVVGVGCRFPGEANGGEAFWNLLAGQVDAVSDGLPERWRMTGADHADTPAFTRFAGLVDGPDLFDADFFGISPREASSMDPQQRLLLEVAWEALENAGIDPNSLYGSSSGVYVGLTGSDYPLLQLAGGDLAAIDGHFGSGGAHSVASGRLSYILGLRGPSLSIDTACSSSLVSVHLACEGLRHGECDLAIAGGVNLILSTEASRTFAKAGMLSPAGRCKSFSSLADGFVRGEGCGVVVLKRLSAAVASGERVLAVIRGSAVNHDGPSSGLTVPNGLAQQALIRRALAAAGVAPSLVGYVEAHGTGTALGDPIEAEALGAVFAASRAPDRPLVIGSVKTNLGHLEAAAGVAGLIKVVLALGRGALPGQLHCQEPSPHIRWAAARLAVAQGLQPWAPIEGRRIAGVSAFGFSGTNAHLVVEEAPAAVRPPEMLRAQFLPVSAHTGESLVAYASALRDAVTADISLADVARTLGAGRAHRKHRAAIVVDTISAFRDALNALANCRDDNANLRCAVTPHRDPPRLAFLFTGQGAQYPGMGAALYAAMPAFRAAFDRCDAILLSLLGASLRDTVLESSDATTLAQTGLAQPALFVLEYALAETLRSVGVTPVAVMGHSVGELVAACVAAAIELPDALRLVAARGALMQALPDGGAMTAVFASESQVAQAVAAHAARVSIAALNGPMQTVISGHAEAVAQVSAELAAAGIKTQPLAVSHAFHSPLIEPVMAEFEQKVAEITFAAPQLAVISNVTGQRLGASELASPRYWSRHLRAPVRFADGLKCLATLNVDICVELGPHPTLTTFAADVFTTGGPRVMPTLRRGKDDRRAVLDVLGELYLAGVEIDWRGLDADHQGMPIALPTSPFVRRRHWFRRKISRAIVAYEHPLLGHRVRAAVRDLVLFEAELDVESADFIADHVVHGRAIMPAAAMIEMALGACIRSGGAALGATIQSFVIAAPLTFEHGPRLVQTLVRMEGGRPAGFEILSSAPDNADKVWTLHAQGEYVERAIEIHEDHILPPGAREISAAAHYDALADRGLTFGNSLKLVQRVHAAPNLALGEIAAVAGSDYTIEPALLDACLQVMAAAPQEAGEAHLPISIDRVSYAKPPVGIIKSYVVIRQAQSNLLRADVLVSDAEGIVMQLKGIALRPVRAASTSDLYRVEWRKTSEMAKDASWTPTLGRAQKVALIGGTEALQRDLADELIRRGNSVSFETLDPSTDIVAYLAFIAADQDDPLDALRTSFAPLLALVQRLGAHGGDTRLVLVTRGAAASSHIAPVQAAALGFVRTASAELGELRPALVDLDPDKPADVQIDTLVSALLSPGAEPEQALRDNAVLASRLTRVSAGEPAQMRLRCGDSGILDDLVLAPSPRPGPGPGQLEIRVTATSLNFRDVMNALSMRSDDDPLGGECAGVVSAVGAGVKGFAVGDNVVALASGAFATYVLSDASFVVKQPHGWTDCQAAALPLVTMTAQHALVDVARLQPGQTVLIHAGAGGVGMAAMQIAKRCGARIFATAGTEQKRSLLGKLGAARTFSSRTLDFEREIAIATDGRGVDVILNSLAGPFIEASVRCLAADGSFLEIGKSGILSRAQFHAMRPDACYSPLDLATMPTRDHAGFERLFRAVMADAASEILEPLPVRVFPLTCAKEAFSFMAHARHVGKVVLKQDRLADGASRLDPNGVYLITGAYGGIGFATAERLFERGARGLVLIGRTAPSGEVKAKLDAWRAAGAQIQELTGDVSSPSTVADVFARIDACGRPLRGVIHSAGELSDGALLQQDWERFEPPLRAKVRGAWLLHRHTKARRLEFFALFSSVAGTLGAPGQTNHAVANAFMDALAHYRRERGLPAISLAWGAWSKLGAAAARGADARAAARGAGVITPARGLDILEILIADAPAHTVVTPMDWRAFLSHRAGKPPLFYADVASESPLRAAPGRGAHSARKDDDILRRLQQSVPSARRELLTGVVAAAAQHVLGGTGDVDPARPLSELGLDSMLAVELRNRLGTTLALSPGLPATVVFDCPTIDLLVVHLMARLWPAAEPSAPEATTALGPTRVADNVDDLSDAEVDAMFERMVGP